MYDHQSTVDQLLCPPVSVLKLSATGFTFYFRNRDGVPRGYPGTEVRKRRNKFDNVPHSAPH